jgi:PDZ domain-containing protein
MKPSKPSFTAAGALCALVISALHPAAQEGPEPGAPQEKRGQEKPESGLLRKLDPSATGEDPARPDDLFARDFDAAVWRRRLTEPDLARREKSYDALQRRARLDPMARAFLEELAGDDAGGELAWTARLALRELGRARFPLQGMPSSPFGLEPYPTDPFGGMQRMQGLMNELFAHEGLGRGLPRAPGAGRSLRLEQRDGRAVITITETIDGQDSTRRYEGASVAEILAEHPELEPELDGLRLVAPEDVRRFPGLEAPSVPLAPQARSRPLRTDRLGVVVQPLAAARARELGLESGGLRVERTVPGSYAQLIGVDAGDVLLELDGKAVASGEDIEARMKARGADDALTLVWLDELGQRHERTWRAPEPASPR